MKSNVKIDKHEPCTITFKTFKNALESQAFSIFLSAFVFGASWIVATSYKELHLTSSDMWVFAIICLFSLIVFLISITRFKKTLNHLIEFATEISKPTFVSPFQSLNDELAETYNNELRTFVEEHDGGLPSGCVGDIHYKSGFNEKVVSEFDDLKQPESSDLKQSESSESESTSESQTTSESSEVDEQTSENNQ
jgi:hypothetical protein